ncbi:MAG: AI-2E family transporter [Candidatus Saccharibacteria bacterium]|nr:AI-2E family transporter [Candidatus Saccharibacteria bacterium]
MKVKIEIDTRTFVRFWLVVIGFALAAFLIYSARTALIIIGTAFFLAIALSPPVNRLAKILPGKSRVLGTAISYFIVILILGTVLFLIVPPIVEQTAKFTQNIPSLINSATNQSTGISDFIRQYHLQPEVDKVFESIKNYSTHFVSGIGSVIIYGIGSVVSVVTATILIIALTFLMLVEGPAWMERLWSLYHDKSHMEHHRKVVGKMYKSVTNYVVGQLSVSTIAGLVAGLLVLILSVIYIIPTNLAIPAAALIFLFSLIPLFGETVGSLFVTSILAINNVTAAIIFLIFFIIYQQIEANYISPKIQSKRNDLTVLTILIAVTVGIYLFGIIGGIISIPIAGCIDVLVEDRLSKNKKLSTD